MSAWAMRGVIAIALAAPIAIAAAGYLSLRAQAVTFEMPAKFTPDATKGRYLATAAGCRSCHGAPPDMAEAGGENNFGGGRAIASPFGPIYAPNISSDRRFGIGAWTDQAFLNAVKRGVSPRGAHYYPAFPYARFAGLSTSDVLDIKAYLATLPPVARRSRPTSLPPPFNLRIGVGLWKRINAPEPPRTDVPSPEDSFGRGRYLVEHAAHCQECHTPRTLTLGLSRRHAFEGAAGFDGTVAPPLTPQKLRRAGFDAFDQTLRYGLTLDGTSSIEAAPMLDVIENISMLTESDRRAIYAYLTERHADAQP